MKDKTLIISKNASTLLGKERGKIFPQTLFHIQALSEFYLLVLFIFLLMSISINNQGLTLTMFSTILLGSEFHVNTPKGKNVSFIFMIPLSGL